MPADTTTVKIQMMAIEAAAAGLRRKLEGGGTWPGEISCALDRIDEALSEARQAAGNERYDL